MAYYRRLRRVDSIAAGALLLGFTVVLGLSMLAEIRETDQQPDTGCGIEALSSELDRLDQRPFIAVVGDGVGQAIVTTRPYNTQFAQGYDVWQGVRHALTKDTFADLQRKVNGEPRLAVVYVDDGGNPTCAAHAAKVLAARPHLLGVIGHSTTSCTQEALPYYRAGNIPVLIPAATNPDLLKGHEHHTFRLPSNDSVQALVISHYMLTELESKTVFVIWDATAEAAQYSEYLKNAIQYYLNAADILTGDETSAPTIEGSYPISLNPLNYTYLFRRIVSSNPDVVVFVGYGSLAREFLLGLDYEYDLYPDRARPAVVLTDGCKIPGLETFDFEAHLAFSAAPLATFPAFESFDPGEPVPRHGKMYLAESFEVFGYDASVLLLGAIKTSASAGDVARQRIIRHIKEPTGELPLAYSYLFVDGENQRGQYYLYSLSTNSIAATYTEQRIAEIASRAKGAE